VIAWSVIRPTSSFPIHDEGDLLSEESLTRLGILSPHRQRDPRLQADARAEEERADQLGGVCATAAAALIQAGLVDEYRLYVHPLILGAGTRFFPPLDDRIGLKLLETRTFGSGVVYLRYEMARPAG
jgi:transcriptional regulator GlxA family with amidase domain